MRTLSERYCDRERAKTTALLQSEIAAPAIEAALSTITAEDILAQIKRENPEQGQRIEESW